jgi:hypothetical protein
MRRVVFAVAVLWVTVVVALSLIAFERYATSPLPNREEHFLGAAILLTVLSMPAGYVANVAASASLAALEINLAPVTGALMTVLLCLIAGYLQWFVCVPAAWRWIRRRGHRAVREEKRRV